jgi:hypothetical protein
MKTRIQSTKEKLLIQKMMKPLTRAMNLKRMRMSWRRKRPLRRIMMLILPP